MHFILERSKPILYGYFNFLFMLFLNNHQYMVRNFTENMHLFHLIQLHFITITQLNKTVF